MTIEDTIRSIDREGERRCRHCGLPWPGDRSLTPDDLRRRYAVDMPICIRAPRADRWFLDSGINGHIFEESP